MEIYSSFSNNKNEEEETIIFNNNKESSEKNEIKKNKIKNKLSDYNQTTKSENKNREQERKKRSDSLNFGDKINFYEVQKKNMINYMTPIKNKNKNIKYNKKKKNTKSENNINNIKNIHDEIFNLFLDSNDGNKNIMVSELDIELSNSNSNSNYYTDYKNNEYNFGDSNNERKSNNINMIKKREIDFKKEIEQNLRKFLQYNQEKNNEEKNNDNNEKENENIIKNQMKIKINKLKKQSNDINHCLTDINQKNTKYKNVQNSFVILKNKLNFYNPYQNNTNFNASFKNQTEYNIKNNNNINKKYNEIIKINLPNKRFNNRVSNKNKKTNLNFKKQKPFNYTSINELKSKIFYLQNQRKNNVLFNKKNDLSEYFITQRNNGFKKNLNSIGNHFINNIHKEFFNSEKRKKMEKSNKINYNSLTKNENIKKNLKHKLDSNINNNINDKNIIIQNFNCIDYNNINININNSNNDKQNKCSKRSNGDKKSKSIKKNNPSNNYNNHKYSHNTMKLETLHKVNNLCNSYIKKNHKNNTSLNYSKYCLEKKNIFKRKNNEKKLTYKENPDIKNKIISNYLKKKDLIKKKLKYIKVNNNFQLKKYFNTINTNIIITEESLSSKKNNITKQKTFKKIDNINLSNNNILKNAKFIRPRKEKSNTQTCSNNIKKNLFKFITFK